MGSKAAYQVRRCPALHMAGPFLPSTAVSRPRSTTTSMSEPDEIRSRLSPSTHAALSFKCTHEPLPVFSRNSPKYSPFLTDVHLGSSRTSGDSMSARKMQSLPIGLISACPWNRLIFTGPEPPVPPPKEAFSNVPMVKAVDKNLMFNVLSLR
jgi:hypothetical protein